MLVAFLKGKLSREQQNLEDLLTSTVFGLLKYFPEDAGLFPFLRLAALPNGEAPLASIPEGTSAEYEFWPSWQKPGCAFCEPDVVLRLSGPDGAKMMVLVEAKYRSDKSSEADDIADTPPADQLAKEWDNLLLHAESEGATPILVYLTADIGCPRDDVEASVREHRLKRGSDAHISWLSWRHLDVALDQSTLEPLRDLRSMIRRLGLTFFQGISMVDAPAPWQWAFERRGRTFRWQIDFTPVVWRFNVLNQRGKR